MIETIETVKDQALIPAEKLKATGTVKKELLLYNSAINYLYAKTGDNDVIHYYLNLYKRRQLNNMKDLYFQLLEHAKKRQGSPYPIDAIRHYRQVLCDFDPAAVADKYTEWKEIFESIKDVSRCMDGNGTSGKKGYWVLYSKTILSAARFLGRFNTLSDFKDYVQSFVYGNKDKRIALALLLSNEIDGFGFMMACDFLKEWISPFFVKPDNNVKVIFLKTHFCSKNDTDFDVCRRLIEFADTVGQTPYTVDRVFWLISNGRLFRTEERKREVRITTSKEEFITNYLNEVASR